MSALTIFVWLLRGLLCITLSGFVVLAATPSFRRSFLNILIFVIGVIPGIFILENLLLPRLNAMGELTDMPTQELKGVAFVVYFLGALMGGTTLVRLKMLLSKVFGTLLHQQNTPVKK
jgi:hypothetical protein